MKLKIAYFVVLGLSAATGTTQFVEATTASRKRLAVSYPEGSFSSSKRFKTQYFRSGADEPVHKYPTLTEFENLKEFYDKFQWVGNFKPAGKVVAPFAAFSTWFYKIQSHFDAISKLGDETDGDEIDHDLGDDVGDETDETDDFDRILVNGEELDTRCTSEADCGGDKPFCYKECEHGESSCHCEEGECEEQGVCVSEAWQVETK